MGSISQNFVCRAKDTGVLAGFGKKYRSISPNKFQAKSQISVKLSLLDKKTEIFYHEFDSVLSEDLKTKGSYQEKLIFAAEKLKLFL